MQTNSANMPCMDIVYSDKLHGIDLFFHISGIIIRKAIGAGKCQQKK